MNYIIEIGYQKFFLQGDTGLATLLKTLGRMHQITDYEHDDDYKIASAQLREVRVNVSPTTLKLTTRKNSKVEIIDPEVIPPKRQGRRPRAALSSGAKHIETQGDLKLLGGGS